MSSEAANVDEQTTFPTSISLEVPLHEAAKVRAKKRRQSFSGYVASLIEQDLAKGKVEEQSV